MKLTIFLYKVTNESAIGMGCRLAIENNFDFHVDVIQRLCLRSLRNIISARSGSDGVHRSKIILESRVGDTVDQKY